jgi:hypothetical protein
MIRLAVDTYKDTIVFAEEISHGVGEWAKRTHPFKYSHLTG